MGVQSNAVNDFVVSVNTDSLSCLENLPVPTQPTTAESLAQRVALSKTCLQIT